MPGLCRRFLHAGCSSPWTDRCTIDRLDLLHLGPPLVVSDTAPRQAVSSVVGIGGMAGAIGGMFGAKFIGYVLQWTGSYAALFGIAATAYLVNLAIIHAPNPRLEPMEFDTSQAAKP
jgi:nitrate/nitrite transporter NarK